MRPGELERWALKVVDQVAAKSHAEDSLVELKADWPEPADAARKIAAHANAARGATILWIIGLDEKSGVCGAQTREVADWFAGVAAQFDGVYPEMMDVNVPVDDKTMVALAFRTDRAPYVVRNPKYGQSGGGAIQWEVPWREGRSTRTATRQDLLRLLAPIQLLPEIECLDFRARVVEELTDSVLQVHKWYAEGSLFVAPAPGVTVTLPTHRATLIARSPDSPDEIVFGEFIFYAHDGNASNPVSANHAAATIRSPGIVFFSASFSTSASDRKYPDRLSCELQLPTVGGLVPCRIDVDLRAKKRGNGEVGHWSLQGDALYLPKQEP